MLTRIIRKISNTIFYILVWIGLRVFYESHIYEDEDGRIIALTFSNDARYIMLLKDDVEPVVKAMEELENKVLALEHALVEAGGFIDYGKSDRDQKTEGV